MSAWRGMMDRWNHQPAGRERTDVSRLWDETARHGTDDELTVNEMNDSTSA
jgi:hypothetical protein